MPTQDAVFGWRWTNVSCFCREAARQSTLNYCPYLDLNTYQAHYSTSHRELDYDVTYSAKTSLTYVKEE